MIENLTKWKKEVYEFNTQLVKLLNEKSNHKDLYFGFEIFDGKPITNPEILFIGINPGRGNEESDKNLIETDQISYLDIYNDDYRDDYPNTYHLAEKTIKFFRLINWGDEKIKSVFEKKVLKTNFFNLATENINDLKTVINDIEFWDEYFKKSAYFSVQLINLLKPKVVILEGKTVFNNIVEQCYQKKYGLLMILDTYMMILITLILSDTKEVGFLMKIECILQTN